VVHIGSTGTNTAPTVINGTGTATAGVAFNGSLSPLATDAEGDALTFVAVTQPGNGTLSLNPDGTFAYTPDSGFSGSDSFTFRANDGLLSSGVATFTINVNSTGDGFDLDVSGVPGVIATSKNSVTPLDPTVELTNVDPTVNFSNANIRATITSGANSKDKLVVTDGSGGGGVIEVKGKKVFFNGSLVARISGGKRNQPLQVSFESSGTVDAVNAVLQRIGIRTTKNAGGGTRTIQLQVNADGSVSTATVEANL
jgi:hypothetical protein